MRPKLTIVDHYDDTPEPSRAEVEQERIAQQHREYRSPERDVSNPTGWHPYTHPAVRAKVLDVDAALSNRRQVPQQQSRWWQIWR